MKIKRTITIVIEQDSDLRNTIAEFNKVQQRISPTCFNDAKPMSALSLHKECYKNVRGIINSQLTCTAIRLVAGAYCSAKSNKRKIKAPFAFKRKSALFLIGKRGRDASFHKSGKLSIWTTAGRKKIDFSIPEHFKDFYDKAVCYDSLNVFEKNGILEARLCLTLDVVEPKSILPVGVDLNETNAVVAVNTSSHVFFEAGNKTKIKNRRTRKTKRRLQKKLSSHKADGRNTKSVVRVIKRLKRKEARRTKDFACCVAKRLCDWSGPNSVIVFEDLKFKQQDKYDGKKKSTHRKLSAFPHAEIRQRITNRAELAGIGIEKVNPYNTSQICSRCGLIGVRSRHNFTCPHCNFSGHSDINAAVNIRNRFTGLRASGVQSITPEAS